MAMARASLLLCWLSWAVVAVAQFQSFSPPGPNGITYSVHVPANTARSGSGPIYFQLNATSPLEWFALGQGTRMQGANIFVVYTAGNNVTVSPRLGVGHVQPHFNDGAQVALLEGSGVHNGVITANVRCDSCIAWSGGSEDVKSTSSSWIWAVKAGQPLNSTNVTANIMHHDDMGRVSLDLQKATGDNSANPFTELSPATANNSVEVGPGFDAEAFHRKTTAHAVLMIIAFVILFPSFALALHAFPAPWIVNAHASLQLFTLALAIAGLGLGISMAKEVDLLGHYHPIIGIVVVASLFLFQPAMGLLQHRFYRKTGRKGPFAYVHRWFGRIFITLGIINAGLGFHLVGVGTPGAPRGAVIAYGVVAGIVGLVFISIVSLAGRKRRRLSSS